MILARRSSPIALLLAALFLTGTAQGQTETVEVVRVVPQGLALDSSWLGTNRTLVILRDTGETVTFPLFAGNLSGETRLLFDAVLIHPGEPAVRLQVGLVAPLPSGTRLGNISSDNRECCLDVDFELIGCTLGVWAVWNSTMERLTPRNSSPMLFTSTAELTGESIGVITGQQDEDGFAEAVLTRQGQKPTFATLHTDELLEPADRIVDLVELDNDPETGITLYGGYLEY